MAILDKQTLTELHNALVIDYGPTGDVYVTLNKAATLLTFYSTKSTFGATLEDVGSYAVIQLTEGLVVSPERDRLVGVPIRKITLESGQRGQRHISDGETCQFNYARDMTAKKTVALLVQEFPGKLDYLKSLTLPPVSPA